MGGVIGKDIVDDGVECLFLPDAAVRYLPGLIEPRGNADMVTRQAAITAEVVGSVDEAGNAGTAGVGLADVQCADAARQLINRQVGASGQHQQVGVGQAVETVCTTESGHQQTPFIEPGGEVIAIPERKFIQSGSAIKAGKIELADKIIGRNITITCHGLPLLC